MDLKIISGKSTYLLSKLGVFMTSMEVSSPKINVTSNAISYKNGNVFEGATHSEKSIEVKGYYYAKDELDDLNIRDKLNSIFGSLTPYRIVQMLGSGEQYSFERPGEKSGDLLSNVGSDKEYKYGFNVLMPDSIDYEFQGKSTNGLLSSVSFSFVTSGLPYGSTVATNIDLTNKTVIPYDGTATVSQFDWPFYLEMVSTVSQGYTFDVVIDGIKFTYTAKGKININVGDVFIIRGYSTTLNGNNVNDQTNIEYFKFRPTDNKALPYSTTFKGNVTLKNKIDFYI